MAIVECAGVAVLEGELHMPERGAWFGRLKLDVDELPTGATQLIADGGFTLACAILDGGVYLDSAHVRIAGGAGGMATIVAGTWRQPLLRDPLQAILAAAGETLSSTVDSSLLATQLPAWTIGKQPLARALDSLATAAARAVGAPVFWRALADGTIWIGIETWPAVTLADEDALLHVYPSQGRYVIGAQAPSLMPGVALDGVGNVVAVDHWIAPSSIRTWAFV